MSSRALPPPELDGFTYLRRLGEGGFADVFLYRQHLPVREVAVKVMRKPVQDHQTQIDFEAEANLMASVSPHPNIVSVFGADIASDGRPFIVMEYCPPPHFGERLRSRPLRVAETLDIGVRVASAVAYAHKAGIIHRDIKPSNILASHFGAPGLTDFGISASLTDGQIEETFWMSLMYAAPEMITEESAGDERSDVYSLAATVYALLAGHSPFDQRGNNDKLALTQRILNDPVPALGRPDVPRSLENVLLQGLSKRPETRPPTARAFARRLQDVELELRLAPTPLAGLDGAPGIETSDGDLDGGDDPTRYANVQIVRPDISVADPPKAEPSVEEIDGGDENDGTIRRGGKVVTPLPVEPLPDRPEPRTELETRRHRPPRAGAAVGAAAALLVVVLVALALNSTHHSHAAGPPTSVDPSAGSSVAGLADAPVAPRSLSVVPVSGTSEFRASWQNGSAGDTYSVVITPSKRSLPTTTHTSVTFVLAPGEVPCVEVTPQSSKGVPGPSAGTCWTKATP